MRLNLREIDRVPDYGDVNSFEYYVSGPVFPHVEHDDGPLFGTSLASLNGILRFLPVMLEMSGVSK